MPDLKPQKKLAWLGLQDQVKERSIFEKEVALLRENFSSYSAFQSAVDSYSEYTNNDDTAFKSELESNGFNILESEVFVKKCQDNFTDEDSSGSSYDEFKSHTNDSEGYAEFKSAFSQNTTFTSRVETESGDVSAAGVEVHDTDGTTRDGVQIPAGGIEIFGREVHFSQTGNTKTGTGTGTSGSSFSGPVTFVTDFKTKSGDKVFDKYETVTFEVTIENRSSYEETATITLFEDGSQYESIRLGTYNSTRPALSPGETRTVEFDVSRSDIGCHDYRANISSEITVCWSPAGLTV